MVDTRFHHSSGSRPLFDLLDQAGHGGLIATGVTVEITGADELDAASTSDIALAVDNKYTAPLTGTRAGAVITGKKLIDKVPTTAIAVVADDPHRVFADVLDVLYPDSSKGALFRLLRQQGAEPKIENDVLIAPGASIGPGCEIGAGTIIGPNAVIGAGVAIGRNCVIAAGATIEYALVGNSVTVHAGARIGTEGFGWLDHGRSNRKIPQLGRVIVQDRVEIGANTTIDRGALGDTVIGEGTKIDNLVQIGHNCRIGRNCLIAAMSGLSGSTILEDSVLLGGGAGTAGHLTIGSGSIVYGRAGVTKSWPAGSKISGTPAQDIKSLWREAATVRRLLKGGRGES